MSSMWGNVVRIQIFGESHGGGIGVVMDGMPSGEAIDLDELQAFMARRGYTISNATGLVTRASSTTPAWTSFMPPRSSRTGCAWSLRLASDIYGRQLVLMTVRTPAGPSITAKA